MDHARQDVDVAVRRHRGEHVAAHHLAAIRHARVVEQVRRAFHHGGEVEERRPAAEGSPARIAGDQPPLAAANVHHPADAEKS